MAGSAPTLRSLAQTLGLSRTTISEALRGSPRVNAETARLVREAAAKAGYRPNPLAGEIMAEIRRSRTGMIRGALAAVEVEESVRPRASVLFHRELMRGASERAEALGFRVDKFVVGPSGVPLRRLEGILRNRGIHGVILLPVWGDPDFTAIDWSHFAGVYADYFISTPPLSCVCCDHFRGLYTAMDRLYELGYRRPGFFVWRHRDDRLQHRWEGSFLAYQNSHPDIQRVPTLVADPIDRRQFQEWFRKYNPDVVIGHESPTLEWMQEAGARVPDDHGFMCLNRHMTERNCAGLDQHPALIGARAAEIVIAQLHRNERGVPPERSFTTVLAHFVDGPTVRRITPEPTTIRETR